MSAVSAHAILRWLERVERMDLEAVRATVAPGISDKHLVGHLRLQGVDIDRVISTILSPATQRAIELGAIAVRRSGFRIVIEKGVVVTVLYAKALRHQREVA